MRGPTTAVKKPAKTPEQKKQERKEKKAKKALPIGAGVVAAEEPKGTKQRILVVSSRGIVHKHRHLMNDLVSLLPHASKDSKLDPRARLADINEICEMRNCNNCLFFEARKHTDLYMWMCKAPNGPSVKFHVENIHTMAELNFTGNHMLGSRPFLVFDKEFDSQPHTMLMKEMFTQTFSTPQGHRKSKPFHDHILSFFYLDNRVWMRNYQIAQKEFDKRKQTVLIEVGPRLCLHVARIFSGSFEGSVLYSNPTYVSPNAVRAQAKAEEAAKYKGRKETEQSSKKRHQSLPIFVADPLEQIFANNKDE